MALDTLLTVVGNKEWAKLHQKIDVTPTLNSAADSVITAVDPLACNVEELTNEGFERLRNVEKCWAFGTIVVSTC